MASEHSKVAAGKRRKLEVAAAAFPSSKDAAALTDEELARRLHEELNAGMTRRRGSAPVQPLSMDVAPEHKGLCAARHSKAAVTKPPAPPNTSSREAGNSKASQATATAAAPASSEAAAAMSANAEPVPPTQQLPRKKALLNRELAKLFSDMPTLQDSPSSDSRQRRKQQPAAGEGAPAAAADGHDSSGEDTMDGMSAAEQKHQLAAQLMQQRVQQQLGVAAAAVKQETSSCGSEQERVLSEHLQLVAGSPKQGKLCEFALHQAKAAPACSTSEVSSLAGGSSSSKGSEQEQQQQQQHQGRARNSGATPATTAAAATATTAAAGGRSTVGASGAAIATAVPAAAAASAKIPKLPMVQYGAAWYRARVIKQTTWKVLLEYTGYNHEGGPFWLPKDSPRLWRGSYKGRDWKYLGDGAWEPKPQRGSRGRPGKAASTKTSRGPTGKAGPSHKKAAAPAAPLRRSAGIAVAAEVASDSEAESMDVDGQQQGGEGATPQDPASEDGADVQQQPAEQEAEQEGLEQQQQPQPVPASSQQQQQQRQEQQEEQGEPMEEDPPSGQPPADDEMGTAAAAAAAVSDAKPDIDIVAPFAPMSLRVRTARSKQQQHSSEPDTPDAPSSATGTRRSSRGAAALQQHPTGKRSTRSKRSTRATGPGRLSVQTAAAGVAGSEGARVELKGGSSSDALPAQPKSPTGASPRAHRRKGIPQRSRLESSSLTDALSKPSSHSGGLGKGRSGSSSLARSSSMGGSGRSGSEPDFAAAAAWSGGGVGGSSSNNSRCLQEEPLQVAGMAPLGLSTAAAVVVEVPAVADALQQQRAPASAPAAEEVPSPKWQQHSVEPAQAGGPEPDMDEFEAAALMASLGQAPWTAGAGAAAGGKSRPRASPGWDADGDVAAELDSPRRGRWGASNWRSSAWAGGTAHASRPPRHPSVAAQQQQQPGHPGLYPAPARVTSRSIDRMHQAAQRQQQQPTQAGGGAAAAMGPGCDRPSGPWGRAEVGAKRQQPSVLGLGAGNSMRHGYNSNSNGLLSNGTTGSQAAPLHRLLQAVGQMQVGGPELLDHLYQPAPPAAPVQRGRAGLPAPASAAAAAAACEEGPSQLPVARSSSCAKLLANLPSLAAVQDMAVARAAQVAAEGWQPCRDMPLFR